jgi:hypothetical protein
MVTQLAHPLAQRIKALARRVEDADAPDLLLLGQSENRHAERARTKRME